MERKVKERTLGIRGDVGISSALLAQVWTSSSSGASWDRWLADTINTANTTVYDKAIDSVYLDTRVGGSQLHHLVDGQHDLLGAFTAARNALPDDSIGQEIMGTAHHLLKDVFSVSGLPVFSIQPATYSETSRWIRDNLGIPLSWQGDFLQLNAMELLGGSLAAVGVVLGLRKRDVGLLGEVVAASGIAGILAANPISLLCAILAIGIALKVGKNGDLRAFFVGVLSGGAASGAALLVGTGAATVLGAGVIPAVFSMAVSIAAAVVVRNQIKRLLVHTENVTPAADKESVEFWMNNLHRLRDGINRQMDPIASQLLSNSLVRSQNSPRYRLIKPI